MGLKEAFSALISRRSDPPQSGADFAFPAYPPFSSRDISLNSTVQACGNVIGNAIATMPLNLMFTDATGARKRAGWDSRHGMLKYRPNLTQTPTVFFRQGLADILGKGNWYLWRTEVRGITTALTRLVPEGVYERYASDGTTTFCYGGQEYRDGPGCPIMRITSLVTDDHGKGFSPLTFARTAVQLGIQLDEFSLSSFGNGINTKLIIDVSEETKDMNDEAAAKYARAASDYVRATYTGAENSGRPFFSWWKKPPVEIKGQSSNHDAELLESRKFQEREICKVLGPPVWLITGDGAVPYGNLEAAMTLWLNLHIKPYLFHIAQSFDRSLLTPYEQGAYGWEFDFSSFLKPDAAGRLAYYKGLWSMGAIDADGIDAAENLPANPNGTGAVRFIPAQNMPSTPEVIDAYMASAKQKAADIVAGKAAPAPADPPVNSQAL
jgi:HK97 family phage portal protein